MWRESNITITNCLMYLGGNKNNNYYSLTNNALNTINTWNNGIIYLGDYYVNN